VINDTRAVAQVNEQTPLPRLVSLAVHELRTPLAVVAGYLRMLLREQGGPLTEKQRKMLEEAGRSCARIGALVGEMSELGKLEAHELGLGRMSFDLAALVAEQVASLPANNRGVQIEVHGGDRPLTVTADRVRMATAIGSLLHSVIRERGKPGTVVAACSQDDTWGVVAIGDAALIPPLTRNAGATPQGFDEWRGGMGLALPIARRVLEAQGGALWSLPDGPSRAAAAFRLPLAH
jgi:signal transduction histidine kinase